MSGSPDLFGDVGRRRHQLLVIERRERFAIAVLEGCRAALPRSRLSQSVKFGAGDAAKGNFAPLA